MVKSTPTTKIICAQCSTLSYKSSKEITRHRRKGRNVFFCGLSCAATYSNINNPRPHNDVFARKDFVGRVYDEKSPFRKYISKARTRHKEVDLSIEYLMDMWKSQNGRCIYSNIKLELVRKTGRNDIRTLASLDRIDSSKGYVRGNVQFISASLNLAKSTLSHVEFQEFMTMIKNA